MYEMKRFLEDFYKQEVVDGATIWANNQVQIKIEHKKEKRRPVCVISVLCEGGKDVTKGKAEVYVAEDNGTLVRTNCDCREYSYSRYACCHVTAGLTAYYEQTMTRDDLDGSLLGSYMAEATGIDTPFRPGILRKTDSSILGYLKKGADASPLLTYDEALPESPMSVEWILDIRGENRIAVEIKAGAKRKYVVRYLYDFLKAYEEKEVWDFSSKTKYRLSADAFTKDAAAGLNLLCRYMHLDNMTARSSSSYGYGTNTQRDMMISVERIDEFMEKVAVHGVFLGNDREVFFDPSARLPKVTIDKLEYGATLNMEHCERLFSTLDYIYLLRENTILRLRVSEEKNFSSIMNVLLRERNVFVSEKELPAVCRDVLPVLSDSAELVPVNLRPEDYMPEKPDIEIYLDYPQEGMFSCQAYAVYHDKKKLSLFKEQKYNPDRDYRTEKAVSDGVRRHFSAYDDREDMLILETNEEGMYRFLTEAVPDLAEIGEVFVSDKLKKLKVTPLQQASVGIRIDSGLLEMTVHTDNFSTDELAEILSTYQRKKHYCRLKNGMFVTLDESMDKTWQALSEALEYQKKGSDTIQVPMFRAMYLDDLLREQEGVEYSKSKDYRSLLREMNDVGNAEYEIPASLEKVLRRYQKDGFMWLKNLKAHGFSGILADDMGLGKTLQVQTFLQSEKEIGKQGDGLRTLIITPASLVYNWRKELERFTPELSVIVINGSAAERKARIVQAVGENIDVWITSYDMLKRDVELYSGITFANEIVDEAQFIKNYNTQSAKSVRLVNSAFRLALTGTPIENRLGELWSIFDYLMPGFLYSYARFRDKLESPIVNGEDEDALARIRQMVHPFILRRLKREVLKELPEKIEETITVDMEGDQRKLYSAHEQRLRMYLASKSDDEFKKSKLEILAELTKLRQLCCAPGLTYENYDGPNAKLDACIELVRQSVNAGHKVLLFSQFTSMLDLINEALSKEGIEYYRIDGSVDKKRRIELVDQFQRNDNKVAVFCISLKAGGTGLNLTAADIVIHYDPWWNLAAQNQATDRAHRIGQQRVLTVYSLVAAGSIEERIQALQQSKAKLAEEVLSGGEIGSTVIDRDAILQLLNEDDQ